MAETSPNIQLTAGFEKFLVEHGFLDKEQLAQLDKVKVDKFGKDYLVSLPDVVKLVVQEKFLSEEDVAKARAAFLNLPYADLRQVDIKPELLDVIPPDSRKFYGMVPFELSNNDLKVALLDPSNLQALEALEFLGQKQNYQVHIYLASETSISTWTTGHENIKTVVGEALQDIQEIEVTRVNNSPFSQQKQQQPQILEDAPIIKIVDVILSNAIDAKASDIHIEPSETDVRVRYRIDGILHTSLSLPRSVLSAIVSRVKILANLKIDEQRLPQDGRFHVEMNSKSIDLRVSTLPLMNGEKIVMRLLDKTTSVPTLEELGLRGQALRWVKESILKSHGIFLITGPTGSGKSTTLYSILSMRNTTEVNIVTLEDPVEYFIPGVNQSQVNPDIGLTFASGLRSILRQDPNIVMVGEIRDEETAELAVHAALTGHLVFSTLHTNNAVGALPRLENMNLEPFLLNASINLVMAQRLVRKLCEFCKKETEVSTIVRNDLIAALMGVPPQYLKDENIDMDKFKLYAAQGCNKCGETGYKGRIGIFEVVPMLPDLQEVIFEHGQSHKVYQDMLKLGVISMKQDGIMKSINGLTTWEEIARVTTE